MPGDALGVFQLLLAAAFVGFLVFAVSHGYYVWAARRAKVSDAGRTVPFWLRGVELLLLLLGLSSLASAAIRSAVFEESASIVGRDLFSVRARVDAKPSFLTTDDNVREGDVIARFDSAALEAELKHLEAQPEVECAQRIREHEDRRARLNDRLDALERQYAGLDRERQLQRLAAQRSRYDLANEVTTAEVALKKAEVQRKFAGEELAIDEQLRKERVIAERDIERRRAESVDPIERETQALAAKLVAAQKELESFDQRAAGLQQTFAAESQRILKDTVDLREAISRVDAEIARLRDTGAPGSVKQQETALRRAALEQVLTVRAPFAGRVGYRAPGSDVPDGEALLVVHRSQAVVARVSVPKRVFQRLPGGAIAGVKIATDPTTTTTFVSDAPESRATTEREGWYDLAFPFVPSPAIIHDLAMGREVTGTVSVEASLTEQPTFPVGVLCLLLWLSLVLFARRAQLGSSPGGSASNGGGAPETPETSGDQSPAGFRDPHGPATWSPTGRPDFSAPRAGTWSEIAPEQPSPRPRPAKTPVAARSERAEGRASVETGEPGGFVQSTYENGAVKEAGLYADGARSGSWVFWFPNGQTRATGSFVGGTKNGRWTEWHANGRLRSEGEYKDGERVGDWAHWNPDGRAVDRRLPVRDEGYEFSLDEPAAPPRTAAIRTRSSS